jgi:hypothetical protein
MTEAIATPPAAATAVSTPAATPTDISSPAFDISTCFNPDGTFKQGYKEQLLPEDLRGEKFYDIFTDIKGLAKTAGNQAKMIGKYSTTKGVLPISDKSTPEEIEAFDQALGVPKTADDYKMEIPKGLEHRFDPEMMKQAKQIFKASHFNQSQVDALWKFENERSAAAWAEQEKQQAAADDAAENLIRQTHANDYDQSLHLVRLGIDKVTAAWPQDKREALFGTEEKPGGINDPALAALRPHLFDFLAQIGSLFVESKMVNPEEGGGGAYQGQSQIDALRATPGFADGTLARTNAKRHREIIDEINNLTTRMQPGYVNPSGIGR